LRLPAKVRKNEGGSTNSAIPAILRVYYSTELHYYYEHNQPKLLPAYGLVVGHPGNIKGILLNRTTLLL